LTTEGRRGPVLVNIPKDLLAMKINPAPEDRPTCSYVRHRPAKVRTEGMTDKVYAALAKAKKPLLLAGGGCVISNGGVQAMMEFIRCLGIPVATTLMGKGAVAPTIRNTSATSACTARPRPIQPSARAICCWLSAAASATALSVTRISTIRTKSV
jgi:thiamine pyrophosphate-dependent acetolactate synthase large subunit-like protein